ncbi:MAG: hypothetical protein LRY54_04995 [Alphaproteobacteria bacterium]|nr:hypothetical protein [Alphaproteobacteria bacterium]MCD8563381.1 hypothetical protein [Alphaproteobacteria bacterium]
MTIRVYDVTNEQDFLSLGNHFARALKALDPFIKQGTPYHGEILYHPLQISVLGPVGAGKSTFIQTVARRYFQEAAQENRGSPFYHETRLSVPSASEERDIMAWMRWQQRDGLFEIRSHDDLVLQSLYAQNPDVALPAIEKPHISFREHASKEFQKYSPVVVQLEYDDNGCRTMYIRVNSEHTDVMEAFHHHLPLPS